MRAVISLELIGDNYIQHLKLIESGKAKIPHLKQYIKVLRYGRRQFRPWVAKLLGTNGRGFKRQFMHSARDYSRANSIGSRGIFEYYALPSGLYEINECIKLGHNRRYFIRVQDAQIKKISRDEVIKCLTNAG